MYRIFLRLQEDEAIALAKLAQLEHREIHEQVHHIVHAHLIAVGQLNGPTIPEMDD